MKNCPNCGALKFNFHANGHCTDCESKRHKEIWRRRQLEAAERRPENYLDRHLARREQEATDQHDASSVRPCSQGESVLGFGEPEVEFDLFKYGSAFIRSGKQGRGYQIR